MYDVDLRYADLTGADLTGARLAYLNPSYGPADITGVTWTNAIAQMEHMHLQLETPVLITSEQSREKVT